MPQESEGCKLSDVTTVNDESSTSGETSSAHSDDENSSQKGSEGTTNCHYAPRDSDESKVKFAAEAISAPLPECMRQNGVGAIDHGTRRLVEWVTSTSEDEIIDFREKATRNIEKCGRELWKNGATTEWMAHADEEIRNVSKTVNGPLMEMLAKATDYKAPQDVQMMRLGAPILGEIPAAPCCATRAHKKAGEPEDLRRECRHRNEQLLASLRQDPHCDFLKEKSDEDAGLGRMTPLVPATEVNLDEALLARRFSREQGVKADGRLKLRAVDDESGNGVNECAQQTAKLTVDGLDSIVAAILLFIQITGTMPCLWKADVDAAYRRIPILPRDRWASWVVFLHEGEPMAARHCALMFGAIGAVYGWGRLGAFLQHVLRAVLRVPLFRYVDDFFSLDKQGCGKHAMECAARVVRAMLGTSALAQEKMDHGSSLVVLGIQIWTSTQGVRLELTEEKRKAWTLKLRQAKDSGAMSAGDASKFAGRLNFATQACFHRIGRAMVRPFYAQQYAPLRGGRMGDMLVLATDWWIAVLRERVTQNVPLAGYANTAELFCDASGGANAGMAAVLFMDNKIWYTNMAPCARIWEILCARND